MSRVVLHMDLDAFFCSVEELLDPKLKGKPFVVGGSPDGRGVVASASYAARAFGIRSAMPTARALRLCPSLQVVSGTRGEYGKRSKQVMERLRREATSLQRISIDEAFLELVPDWMRAEAAARRLQDEIEAELGLPSSWGIASNKLVAKIASDVGKPRGMVVVPAGEEARFLAPLPAEMLWGVGPKTRQRLDEVGVRTIGDLAHTSERVLRGLFGDRASSMRRRARGEDDSPVREGHEAKSMSAERTFAEDQRTAEVLEQALRRMTKRVGARLRKSGLAGSTVKLKIRWPDFTTLSRQTKLDQPTDQDEEILATGLGLLHRVWRPGRPVRLLGIGVSDLGPPIRQLELFDPSWRQDQRLRQAVDEIREKFGGAALRRGADGGGSAN